MPACLLCLSLSIATVFPYIPNTYAATTQEDLDKANEALNQLKARQAELSSDFANLNSQLEASGEKIANIDSQITQKQSEINDLQVKINDLS